MNRGRGKHLCRICKQNQFWLSVAAKPDSGILGLQAGEDVNYALAFRKVGSWFASRGPTVIFQPGSFSSSEPERTAT